MRRHTITLLFVLAALCQMAAAQHNVILPVFSEGKAFVFDVNKVPFGADNDNHPRLHFVNKSRLKTATFNFYVMANAAWQSVMTASNVSYDQEKTVKDDKLRHCKYIAVASDHHDAVKYMCYLHNRDIYVCAVDTARYYHRGLPTPDKPNAKVFYCEGFGDYIELRNNTQNPKIEFTLAAYNPLTEEWSDFINMQVTSQGATTRHKNNGVSDFEYVALVPHDGALYDYAFDVTGGGTISPNLRITVMDHFDTDSQLDSTKVNVKYTSPSQKTHKYFYVYQESDMNVDMYKVDRFGKYVKYRSGLRSILMVETHSDVNAWGVAFEETTGLPMKAMVLNGDIYLYSEATRKQNDKKAAKKKKK